MRGVEAGFVIIEARLLNGVLADVLRIQKNSGRWVRAEIFDFCRIALHSLIPCRDIGKKGSGFLIFLECLNLK